MAAKKSGRGKETFSTGLKAAFIFDLVASSTGRHLP
jgi:hypothetical protein